MKKRLLFCFGLLWLSAAAAVAQVAVSGTVRDNDGPVIGAAVVLQGSTHIGTSTNTQGEFTLNVPDAANAVLEIRFVGMVTQSYPVNGRTSGNEIHLQADALKMDDVVVVGYGNKIRSDLTGSVGSVSGEILERIPVSSAAEALQGKVAGVQITSMDGEPGAEINIRIRGGASLNADASPLFIVDGFPVDNINDLPPTDIKSIDILKDASLTAIYGARGGNGVVIVTTKSATSGKVKVSFNHSTQISTLYKKLDLMSPYEYVRQQYDAAVTSNSRIYAFRKNFGNPMDFDLYKRYKGNDWQEEILGGNPLSHMYNLNIGGGSEKLTFNTSITLNDDKGVLEGSGVLRTNVNTKINVILSEKTKLLINPRIAYRQNKGAGAGAVGNGGLIDVLRYRPTNGLRDFAFFPPSDADDEDEAYFKYSNPKGDLSQNYSRQNYYQFTNNVAFEWQIIPGLTFRTEGTLYFDFNERHRFQGYMTSTGRSNNNLPVAEIRSSRGDRYQWTNTVAYGFSSGNHNFSFLAGQEILHRINRSRVNSARYFPRGIAPKKALDNMQIGTPYQNTSSVSMPDRTASFFGQANYNWDRKYLVSATLRADGSTKFAPGNQWGYFPAISGAWVLTREEFMKNQNLFSQLKLRVAIGTAGNNRIDDDAWRYQYSISGSAGPGWSDYGETGADYYVNSGGSTFPNPEIKWETTLTRNVGVDISLFNGRLDITPEVYWNTIKDMLYETDIPGTSGYAKQWQNIAQITNKGFELSVTGTILDKPDALLSGYFNFGRNKSRVDKLNGVDDYWWTSSSTWKSSDNDYLVKVGDQVGLIYGYVYDGIYGFDGFELNAASSYVAQEGTVNCDALFGTNPGRPKFKNFVDGVDGEEDVNRVNENDRVVIGNTNPKFSGGFGLNGVWKNWDFSFNFYYMYGFDINNATRYTLSSFEGNTNNYHNVLADFSLDKRWRYANDRGDRAVNNYTLVDEYREMNENATLFNPVDITKKVTHSYFIEDGSFLRLQDVTIGYTLPKPLTDRIGLERVRLYCSGYNLWIWTKYSGYDPEVDIQTGLTPGVDYNRYPRARKFVFGLNISF